MMEEENGYSFKQINLILVLSSYIRESMCLHNTFLLLAKTINNVVTAIYSELTIFVFNFKMCIYFDMQIKGADNSVL